MTASLHRGIAILHPHLDRSVASIVALGVASAAAYGLGAVLQHRAAMLEDPGRTLRPGLLLSLVRRPRWLIGNALDLVGYGLQFLALRRGSLALVEPLLVLSLALALPLEASLGHHRLRLLGWSAVGSTVLGVALFLGVSHPGLGHPRASGSSWIILAAGVGAFCGLTAAWSHRRGPRAKAMALAAGSGVAFGFVAALTERAGHLLDGGVVHLFESWVPWVLLVAACVALLLTQSAFRSGSLVLSLPTLTVAQPAVAGVIGTAVFGEHLATTPFALVFEAIGVLVCVGGVYVLAREARPDDLVEHR